jgi:hypothetical protein
VIILTKIWFVFFFLFEDVPMLKGTPGPRQSKARLASCSKPVSGGPTGDRSQNNNMFSKKNFSLSNFS